MNKKTFIVLVLFDKVSFNIFYFKFHTLPISASSSYKLPFRVPAHSLHEPLMISQYAAVSASGDVPQDEFVVHRARCKMQGVCTPREV